MNWRIGGTQTRAKEGVSIQLKYTEWTETQLQMDANVALCPLDLEISVLAIPAFKSDVNLSVLRLQPVLLPLNGDNATSNTSNTVLKLVCFLKFKSHG